MTSLLGITLKLLSKDKGQISLIITNPHKRQDIHLGALRIKSRVTITAMISQLAVMLIFNILINKASIVISTF